MADKPKIHTTLAKLTEDTKGKPDTYKLGLSGGKVVTFPDPYDDMDSEASERLLNELNRRDRVNVWPSLKLWLSEDDVKKLQDERIEGKKLTLKADLK